MNWNFPFLTGCYVGFGDGFFSSFYVSSETMSASSLEIVYWDEGVAQSQ